MMKKNYLWLFAILFVAAFTLSACGSDSDDDGNKPVTTNELVGVWVATSFPYEMDATETITISNDLAVSYTTLFNKAEQQANNHGYRGTVAIDSKNKMVYYSWTHFLQYKNGKWSDAQETGRGEFPAGSCKYALNGNKLTLWIPRYGDFGDDPKPTVYTKK